MYARHLAAEALDAAWRRFEAGCVLCTTPASSAPCWCSTPRFVPARKNRAEIEALCERRLPDYRLSVEFRSQLWPAEGRDRERTLALLEERLILVFIDAPRPRVGELEQVFE